ncbi:3-deoxy-D-manno-octulosonic acid transferase [bacterium]|jgi:3-deoxy-D-manno-octulosonic-acid transferase|nr:3-deoxy-D-manno-octulosonic acid transferase [bacterium]
MPRILDAAYLSALSLTLPYWIWRSAKTGKYRQGWSERFLGAKPAVDPTRPRVWIHAVSLGEVVLARQMVDVLSSSRPDLQLLVSTSTDSGLQVASERIKNAVSFRAPLDFSWAVERVTDHIAPSLIILTELELWPHLLLTARERNVPVCVINARVSRRSYRGYRRWKKVLAPALEAVRWWGAQTDEYADRLRDLVSHPDTVQVTGSIKYEGSLRDRHDPAVDRMARLLSIESNDAVWVAGSTLGPEESVVIDVYRSLLRRHPELKLLLVPRHPERFDEVARLLDQTGIPYARRSRLQPGESALAKVILVDSVGELAQVWGLASVGFVGGSLTGARGGQSMIEPAGFGVPCCFGPSTSNFKSTVEQLLAVDGAKVVTSSRDLEETVGNWFDEPSAARSCGQRARSFIESQQGALQKTMRGVEPFLPRLTRPVRAAS